jgi:hypothetical protein
MILTFQKQQTIKPISANNEHKYEQLATEVEQTDLRDLLGVAFLQEVQNNTTDYTDLIEGSEFTSCSGVTLTHKGLEYVLAYLNYAKYIGQSFINDTFSGFTVKQMDDSNPINEGTMKRLINENRKIALTEWELVKEYLNAQDFDLWNSTKSRKPHLPKMTFLRKTAN